MDHDRANHEWDDRTLLAPAVPPADGERRAIVGYYPQYRIAASIILRELRHERLEWIRLADPEAGWVDDFQTGSPVRVDAFQIKWSAHPGSFTFRNLTQGSGDTPCLIAQLADGWQRLRKQRPDTRVVVHLVTNDHPSVNDSLPASHPAPTPRHFSAFLDQVWMPSRESVPGDDWSIPEAWQPVWNELRDASELSEPDFGAFVKDCELEFSYALSEAGPDPTRDDAIRESQTRVILERLFQTVAAPERVIELSRDELLDRMGWRGRTEFRSGHHFPIDHRAYEPIEDTVSALENALDQLAGGYIAVLGGPGSGKSTLLTETLRRRPERLIRYYAFVPGDPSTLRGEAQSFLHDVVLQIDKAGFSPGGSISQFDRAQLLARLCDQFQLLHEDWPSTGDKTVILIDGLDHVERELHPERSFLADLPTSIPDGVFLVLGTQTDELADLPSSVQYDTQQAERRVLMDALTRQQVRQITERALAGELTQERLDRICSLSDGHPLALSYLLNHLRESEDEAAIQAILDESRPYEGDIDRYYHSLWRQIASDDQLVHLFGLLARLRAPIDWRWIRTWHDPIAVQRLRRVASHLFNKEDDDRWYFFHNSFRLFLLEMTAAPCGGEDVLQQALAERCAEEPVESPWAWEELYHRCQAGDHKAVLALATQDYFRSQFFALRPVQAIEEDIRLALRSVAVCHDPVALARIVLSGSEMSQRKYNLEDKSFVPLIIDIEGGPKGAEHVRAGNQLLVDAQTALEASAQLSALGMQEEARRIFELAEPLDLLSGNPIADRGLPQENDELLAAWAEASVHFREVEDIIETVRRVRREAVSHPQMDAEAATSQTQRLMLFHLGMALLGIGGADDLEEVFAELDNAEDTAHSWFWLHVHAWSYLAGHDGNLAVQLVSRVLGRADAFDLYAEAVVFLAEGAYRIVGDEDRARRLLQYVPQPDLALDVHATEAGMNPFLQRLRLNRLLSAFEERRPPRELIPDAEEQRDQGIVIFERSICAFAQLWGRQWQGEAIAPEDFVREVQPLLQLFHRTREQLHEWTSWYVAQGARTDLYDGLVRLAADCGTDVLQALREAIEAHWDSQRTAAFWPVEIRRPIVMAFAQHQAHRRWAADQLAGYDTQAMPDLAPLDRTEHHKEQARAWWKLDDIESAHESVCRMLASSFGVTYRKDYQLSTWVRWLGLINASQPDRAHERIEWFTRAALAMQAFAENRTCADAAREVLEVAFRWSPRQAITLFEFFMKHGLLPHDTATMSLLSGALRHADGQTETVMHLLADLLIPIASDADSDLADRLVDVTFSNSCGEAAYATCQYVADRVDVYALPSVRPVWRQGLARACLRLGMDLCQAGLSETDLAPTSEDANSSRVLVLSTGELLSLEQVRMQCTSPAELESMKAPEDEKSHFAWRSVVSELTGHLEPDDVLALAQCFEGDSEESLILAMLSERLADLGRLTEARSMAEQAIALSSPRGWDVYYDYGTRLSAFKALKKADPDSAQAMALETLVSDMMTDFWWPQNIARNLHEILALITDEVPVRTIWAEIENHVRALFAGTDLPETPSLALHQPATEDAPARALTDLLALHIDHPAMAVLQAAQRACAHLLLKGNEDMQEAVRDLLTKSESCQEHACIVLDAVSMAEPQAVQSFRDQIAGLLGSPNYAIRAAARLIGQRIGCHAPTDPQRISQLPAIYQLELPLAPQQGVRPRIVPRPGEPMPDASDPLAMVQPFDTDIKILSKVIDLPWVNMCHRVAAIMQKLAPREQWSAEAEGRLRYEMDSVGLRFGYRRPRAILARRGMFHATAEIIDARCLPSDRLRYVQQVLRYYDPAMVLAEPESRPSTVAPIMGWDEYGSMRRDWIAGADEAIALALCEDDAGARTIAERTHLRRLGSHDAREFRRSCVCPKSVLLSDPDEQYGMICRRTVECLVEDYPSLGATEDPIPLVLQHSDYGYLSPGGDWLAVNPAISCQLGWHLADDGLFRWVDDQDRAMVETLWWQDGQPAASGYSRDEVGEGWLVVASPLAWDAIEALLGPLKRVVIVERSLYEDDAHELENVAVAEENL